MWPFKRTPDQPREAEMNATDRNPPVPEEVDVAASHRAGQSESEPPTVITDTRDICPHCRGTGRVLTMRDYLDEIVAMLPHEDEHTDVATAVAQADGVIAEFYRRLLLGDNKRPLGDQLAPLFPSDLTTGDALNSKGNKQRDQLWNGLVALLTMYDPAHPESEQMKILNTHLAIYGRSHAAFRRPDGSVRSVTPDEYILVRNVLGQLLQDVFGTAWRPEHTAALLAAYHHAMTEMMYAAQHHNPSVVGRQPRATIGHEATA